MKPFIITILVIVTLLSFGYTLPLLVAYARGHKDTTAIAVLNILGGWTGILWLVALVWACKN
jgi:hypothetical protein